MSGTYERWPQKKLRCAECGERFMSDEVVFERRAGDWTPAVGLRTLAISLAIRIVIVAAIEITCVWLIEWFVAWLAQQSSVAPIAGRVAFWPTIVLGTTVGFAMARRLCDHAGIDSWWIAYVGVIAIVIAAVIANFVVSRIIVPQTIDPHEAVFYLTVAGIITSLWWHYYRNT